MLHVWSFPRRTASLNAGLLIIKRNDDCFNAHCNIVVNTSSGVLDLFLKINRMTPRIVSTNNMIP